MVSYFVAGASRGLGLELVLQLSTLADTSVVFAGMRTLASASEELKSNPKVRVLKLDVTSDEDTTAAIQSIKEQQGKLDVLIINAGVLNPKGAAQASTSELREAIEVNAIAPHRLVVASLPLIKAGDVKKIIAIGSGSGSFEFAQRYIKKNVPIGIYGVSKVALHFLIMLLAGELSSQGIVTATIHPGMVDTDMAKAAIEFGGPEFKATIIEAGAKLLSEKESIEGVISVIQNLKLSDSGNLFAWDGSQMPF